MAGALKIDAYCLGPWQTNCYVVRCEGLAECWIVDAGFEPQPLIQAVQDGGLTPVKLILTHAHADHIAGIEPMRDAWGDLPILIHDAERDFLTDPVLNLSAGFGIPLTAPPATGSLAHGDVLELGEHRFEVRHTPGHSPGGITLHQAPHAAAIVGDTLFADSIGRFDFPTSDGPTLMQSIRQQLLTLPDETVVWPGHGAETTIGREKLHNPFL